jgi:phytoene dehydrogenase-like protein
VSPGNTYDAVIVGGGHNGLVASYYLARAGLRVLVLERRDEVGGACATEELFPGYRISSCSYMCWNLHKKVVADMELERYGLSRKAIDPMPVVPYSDGSYLAFWADDHRTEAEIARISPGDAARYRGWRDFWHRAAGLVYPFFLREPPSLAQIWDHARDRGEEELLGRLLTWSIADVVAEFFDDQRVGAGLVAVCDAGDPYAPGSAWSEAWWHTNSHNGSVFSVVIGGMGSITQAMAAAARERGVEIRTSSQVEEILVTAGRATGVRLVSGEEVSAELVLSNADPKRTFLRLIPAAALPEEFRQRVARISTRVAYLKFHAILSAPPDLSRYLGTGHDPRYSTFISIAPDALDSYRNAWDEAKRGRVPSAPVCNIQVPTAYDETLTDLDGVIASAWVLYAPPRPAHGSWDARREEVGEGLIDHITQFVPNFRSEIRDWQLFTPLDIERRVGMTDGSIRHVDMVPSQLYDQRPLPRAGYGTPIAGLFLCGSGTHPGGEVTGAPGHNAARAVLSEGIARVV